MAEGIAGVIGVLSLRVFELNKLNKEVKLRALFLLERNLG